MALENDQLLVTGEQGAFLFQRDAQSGLWFQGEAFHTDIASSGSGERQAYDIEGSRAVVAGPDGAGVMVYERDDVSGRWSVSAELSTALLDEDAPTISAVDLQGDDVPVGAAYFNNFTGALLALRPLIALRMSTGFRYR